MSLQRSWLKLAVLCVCWSPASFARAQELSDSRSAGYYALHGSLTLLGFAALAAPLPVADREHWPDFGPDVPVRKHFDQTAARWSDILVGHSVTAPVVTQFGLGVDSSFGHALLVYGEAHALSSGINALFKAWIGRPRPFTYYKRTCVDHHQAERPGAPTLSEAAPLVRQAEGPCFCCFREEQGSDAYRSFYSGHTSTAYVGATAGSVLYSLRTPPGTLRHVMWGTQFGLAAAVGQLRIVAGRHYRTDVWAGTAVGVGFGVGVPALHGLGMGDIRGTEVAVGAGSALAVVLASELAMALFGEPSGDLQPLLAGFGESWSLSPIQVAEVTGFGAVGAF